MCFQFRRTLDLVTLQYSITPSDHLEMIKVVRIDKARGFSGIFLSTLGIALSVLIYTRNPRLFGMRTVMIGNEGIRSESEVSTIETK